MALRAIWQFTDWEVQARMLKWSWKPYTVLAWTDGLRIIKNSLIHQHIMLLSRELNYQGLKSYPFNVLRDQYYFFESKTCYICSMMCVATIYQCKHSKKTVLANVPTMSIQSWTDMFKHTNHPDNTSSMTFMHLPSHP